MPADITDSNQTDIELIAEAVHRMDHNVATILDHVAHMRARLDEFEPILGQFKVSGLLAVRRAARNGGKKP